MKAMELAMLQNNKVISWIKGNNCVVYAMHIFFSFLCHISIKQWLMHSLSLSQKRSYQSCDATAIESKQDFVDIA